MQDEPSTQTQHLEKLCLAQGSAGCPDLGQDGTRPSAQAGPEVLSPAFSICDWEGLETKQERKWPRGTLKGNHSSLEKDGWEQRGRPGRHVGVDLCAPNWGWTHAWSCFCLRCRDCPHPPHLPLWARGSDGHPRNQGLCPGCLPSTLPVGKGKLQIQRPGALEKDSEGQRLLRPYLAWFSFKLLSPSGFGLARKREGEAKK